MFPDSHSSQIEDCLERFGATAAGLSGEEAAARLEKHGPNRLPEPPKRHAALRFLSHFHNILIYVLLGSAAITLAMQHYVDTAVILAVVIANAVIGFIQEGKASRLLRPVAQTCRQ